MTHLVPYLTQWLTDANIFDDAYVEYIVSVLNDEFGNSSDEEKITSIVDFLSSVTDKPLEDFANEALAKWELDNPQTSEDSEEAEDPEPTKEQKSDPNEDRRKRDLILQAYGEVEDLDANRNEDDEEEAPNNAQKLADADAAKREKAKKDHANKVTYEKDLLQRDKERKEERKASRKTQKQEKRR